LYIKKCKYDNLEFISARSIHLQFDYPHVDAPSIDQRMHGWVNAPHHMFDY